MYDDRFGENFRFPTDEDTDLFEPKQNEDLPKQQEPESLPMEDLFESDTSFGNNSVDFSLPENGDEMGQLDDTNLTDDFVLGQDFFIDKTADVSELPKTQTKGRKTKKSGMSGSQRGCLVSFLWVFCIFAITIVLTNLILGFMADFFGEGERFNFVNVCKSVVGTYERPDDKVILVEIPSGSSTKDISAILEENGIINHSSYFELYVKFKKEHNFKYGVFEMKTSDGYEEICINLKKNGATAETVKVTIPEGKNIDEIAEILAENEVCKAEQFKTALAKYDIVGSDYNLFHSFAKDQKMGYYLEGYLFADTYNFYNFNSARGAELAIEMMIDNTNTKITTAMHNQASSRGYTMHEILTVASIIEMEASAADYEDKQKVAAIFFNRLEDWGDQAFLQSNPTRDYPYGDGAYNTYTTAGIPVGPMCCPSLDSIKAALYPSEAMDNYYFFITDNKMNFYYNKTNSEHIKTQNQLIANGIYY